jgi:hypothetical protein
MTHRATRRRVARRVFWAAALGVLAAGAGPAALALEEQKGEAAAIEACDKRLCAILVGKSPQGPDLKCALTKTWARSTIKEADSRQLSWGFGDARCSVEINLSRERLIDAMTAERTTFHAGRYTANCVVEQDGSSKRSPPSSPPRSNSATAGLTRSGCA